MAAEPILRAVPDEHTLPPEVQAMQDTIDGLERLNRKLVREVKTLERNHQAEAESSKHWPTAVRLFSYHQRVFNHPGAEWTWQRFELVLPYLRARKLGLESCLRAIAGRRADAWMVEHGHTTWEDIFGERGKFEKCLAHCPSNWKPPPGMPA